MKKNAIAIVAVVLVIAILGGSAVLQVVGVSNPIGKFLLQTPSGSALVLQGAVFNADGSINTTTGQSSSALQPLAVIAGTGGGGGGSCTTSTSSSAPTGQGFGWSVSVTPVYNGTATAMSITGSYTVVVNGVPTATTKTFSYNQIIPSGSKVTIKPLTEDITGAQVVSAVANKPGQFSVTVSPTVTILITYANGQSVSLSGTGSGSGTVSVTQPAGTTYCASALSVSATGGSFSG